jgi:hypothetical protein
MGVNELQYRLLYAIVVAGKSATFAEAAMQRFFSAYGGRDTPFAWIGSLKAQHQLAHALRGARMGNYGKLERSFSALAETENELDLASCSPDRLERIHGIGPKTSRFFILWTRPGARFAALDTHILKWLRFLGQRAPKTTPSSPHYRRLEQVFLQEADRRGVQPRTLDGIIWDFCSRTSPDAGHPWPSYLQATPAPFPAELLARFEQPARGPNAD